MVKTPFGGLSARRRKISNQIFGIGLVARVARGGENGLAHAGAGFVVWGEVRAIFDLGRNWRKID